jgi:hypothetical protein
LRVTGDKNDSDEVDTDSIGKRVKSRELGLRIELADERCVPPEEGKGKYMKTSGCS